MEMQTMRKRTTQAGFAASSLVLMTLYGSPAFAQAGTPAAAEEADVHDSGDIVVTAQRKSERLVDVPLSVTALSADTLAAANISTTTDLQILTPGLRIERFGTNVQPSIRGITSSATSPGAESNVATYVDGIYQPNQIANSIPLPDVASVEVLKGPQGTLFGRNATGGALLIYTRDPEFTTHGDISASYGRFDSYSFKGFATAPLLADTIAVSLAGVYEKEGGWNRDLLNGGRRIGDIDTRLIRGKILFQPTDNLKSLITASYAHRRDGSGVYSLLDSNTIGKSGPGPIANKPWTTSADYPTYVNVNSWYVALRNELDLDFGTITTTTAYAKVKAFHSDDIDASPSPIVAVDVTQPDRNFQQEVVLTTKPFGALSLTAGMFYFWDKSGYDPLLVGGPPGPPFVVINSTGSKSWAAFAEANVELTPRLTAIVGGRYSWEKRSANYGGPTVSDTFNNFTPRVSLSYAITPRTNVYTTYSQGFKSGIYDLNSGTLVPVRPEKVKAYEVGLKTARDTFNFNVAAFYYDYTNLQVQVNTGTLFDALANAASARNYGAEVAGMLKVTRDLRLTGGFSWLHARYRRFPDASVVVPLPGGEGGNTVVTQDVSGQQVTRAPNWTANLSADYSHDFTFGRVGASANLYHTDDVPLVVGSRITQKAYTMVNGQLFVQPGNSGLRITGWIKNLLNEKVVQAALIQSSGDALSYAPPRTYGVTLGYSF